MRILRHHSIIRCIYALLIALPMFSVFGRVIYTQSNKNAKDSYYGETINQSELIYQTTNNFSNNVVYTFDSKKLNAEDITALNINASNSTLYVQNVEVISNSMSLTFTNLYKFNFYSPTDNNKVYFYGYDNENNTLFTTQQIIGTDISFTFNYLNGNILDTFLSNTNSFYYYTYNKYSYLDNAFDYSLSIFVDENHWGKINFFDWFTSLFVDINYNNNALYLHFINWYMNYAMLVSCAYILFLVLMWFINFSRRLLERGMNYDW